MKTGRIGWFVCSRSPQKATIFSINSMRKGVDELYPTGTFLLDPTWIWTDGTKTLQLFRAFKAAKIASGRYVPFSGLHVHPGTIFVGQGLRVRCFPWMVCLPHYWLIQWNWTKLTYIYIYSINSQFVILDDFVGRTVKNNICLPKLADGIKHIQHMQTIQFDI